MNTKYLIALLCFSFSLPHYSNADEGFWKKFNSVAVIVQNVTVLCVLLKPFVVSDPEEEYNKLLREKRSRDYTYEKEFEKCMLKNIHADLNSLELPKPCDDELVMFILTSGLEKVKEKAQALKNIRQVK